MAKNTPTELKRLTVVLLSVIAVASCRAVSEVPAEANVSAMPARPKFPVEQVKDIFGELDPEEFSTPLTNCLGEKDGVVDNAFVGIDLMKGYHECAWFPPLRSPAAQGKIPKEAIPERRQQEKLIEKFIATPTAKWFEDRTSITWGQVLTKAADLPPECQLETLRSAIWAAEPNNPDSLAASFNGFFGANKCLEKYLRMHSHTGLVGLISPILFRYDYLDHPFVMPVKIKLGPHHVVRGVLGLKPGREKRPLVIIRTGTYSEVSGGIGNDLIFSQFFDVTPYNVLFLSSMSGTTSQLESGEFASGGPIEASQMFQILELIQMYPALTSRISGVHVAGLSLGSHNALYTALLASGETNSKLPDNLKVRSSTAVCPVVDLANSVRFVNDARNGVEPVPTKIQSALFKLLVSQNFHSTMGYLRRLGDGGPFNAKVKPDLPDFGPVFFQSQLHRIYDLFNRISNFRPDESPQGFTLLGQLNDRRDVIQTPYTALGGALEATMAKFEDYIDFSSWASQVTIPTFAFYSKDDFVVPPIMNGEKLQSLVMNGKVRQRSGIRVFDTELGSHCGMAYTYSYPIMSQMFGAPIINSYDLSERKKYFSDYSVPLEKVEIRDDHIADSVRNGNAEQISYHFLIGLPDVSPFSTTYPGGRIKLRLTFKSGYDTQTVDETYDIRLDKLAELDPDIQEPLNKAHADALTRWANVNLFLADANGQDIRISQRAPTQLKWWGTNHLQ